MLNGEWVRETLKLTPTPQNEKYAARLVAQVNDAIRYGRFSFEEFFPESPRAKQEGPGTFGNACDLYLRSIRQKTPATQDQYRLAIEEWKVMFGAETRIKALSHGLLKATINEHPWTSAKRMNNALCPLRGVFDLLYPGPQAVYNPMNGITNAAVVKKLPDPLSREERDEILTDMKKRCDPRLHAYYQFAFFTGMRPEELIALRWSDIDFNTAVARVQRVRTFKGGERDGSKTHTVRDVDLVPQAMEALRIMKPYTFLKRVERAREEDRSAEVFERPEWHPEKGSGGGKPSEAGPFHDERVQRDNCWKPSLKRLGIRSRRAYCTRHTYATVALMGGVPPAYIAFQLGHSLQMLLSKYARWIPGADKGSARDRLEAAMAGGISPEFPRMVPEGQSSEEKIGRRDWTRTNSRGGENQ